MSSHPPGHPGPGTGSSRAEPNRKGSVKRARELLEAGVRPAARMTPPQPIPRPPPVRNIAHQTQWPLPASGLQPNPLNPHHPRFLAPRGPPPRRPRRPSKVPSPVPSPSVYSSRSGPDSERNLPYPARPPRSFSQPKPYHQPPPRPWGNNGSCASPTSSADLTPRASVTTDDLFRQSIVSASSASIPDVPLMPMPKPRPPPDPRRRTAGLIAPLNTHKARSRRSSVSPIPEELPNPRQTLGSLASSRAVPSSWGSGPAESEILGAYLEDDSDDDEITQQSGHDDASLVRSASLGKRGKPTMRTITKSTPAPESSEADMPSPHPKDEPRGIADSPLPVGTSVSQVLHAPSPARRASTATTSNESFVDPEKPRFAQLNHDAHNEVSEKEAETLPKATPTMSDKRPGARRPPRLDMDAVRDAETRGSLSSLSDLIRRATKLASNLDRGRTASRTDLATAGADFRELGHRGRNSGSLSDMLASFPNPGLTPQTRSSWPVFFGRSNGQPLGSSEDEPKAKPAQRRCCGMPRKWFILFCILLFIIVALAVLLPVFLVALPNKEKSKACSQTAPCHNGGVSVSSGSTCSCVCSNGYTGSRCTTAGDSSCTSAEVDNGTIRKNATMGSSLPTLFGESEQKFGVKLDGVTIMAIFSLNNISCKTENALVAFDDLASSSGTTRRSLERPISIHGYSVEEKNDVPSRPVVISNPSPVVVVPRALASVNGILYDDSAGVRTSNSKATSNEIESKSADIPTASKSSVLTTSSAKARSSKTTRVSDEVIEFSQVAVMYVLQQTGSMDAALNSGSDIENYLTGSYGTAIHPSLDLMNRFDLDFENKTISGA